MISSRFHGPNNNKHNQTRLFNDVFQSFLNVYVAYFVIVVAQGSAQLVIVHVGLVLAQPPELGHFLGLKQLELAVVGRPADEMFVTLVKQQLQQELPECDGTLHDGMTPET